MRLRHKPAATASTPVRNQTTLSNATPAGTGYEGLDAAPPEAHRRLCASQDPKATQQRCRVVREAALGRPRAAPERYDFGRLRQGGSADLGSNISPHAVGWGDRGHDVNLLHPCSVIRLGNPHRGMPLLRSFAITGWRPYRRGHGRSVRVYVVQLRARCARCKARRKPGMRCCVYVGSTAKSPEERLATHLDPPPGNKRTVVTACGGTLRPDLAPRRIYTDRPAAERAERRLAATLRERGYTVFGGGARRGLPRSVPETSRHQ